MLDRLTSLFELDGESEREGGLLLGMTPIEVVVALVLLVFVFDVVLNDGNVLQAVLGLF